MSKGRVEAFSDGVFAVAATLLIFNVQIDKAAQGGLLAALLAAWPKYAAYVASFLTIGVMWMNHHGVFERIARLDRALVFINLLLLMAIVFIPFSTAELGLNIQVPRDANTAASLYAINAFVIAIVFGAVLWYVLVHPDLLAPNVDRQAAASLASLLCRVGRLPRLYPARSVQPDRGCDRLRRPCRLLRVRAAARHHPPVRGRGHKARAIAPVIGSGRATATTRAGRRG